MYLKSFVCVLLICISSKIHSQRDTIYFSEVTGDTALFSFGWVGNINSDTVKHNVNIVCFNAKDTLKALSSFDILTLKTQNIYKFIPEDTLRKYHLSYDGPRNDSLDENMKLKIAVKKIRFFGKADNSKEKIYTANVAFTFKCKSKVIRRETIKKYMFQGSNRHSFDKSDFITITYWRKQNTERYFFYYRIKRDVTIIPSGAGSKYSIISYLDYY